MEKTHLCIRILITRQKTQNSIRKVKLAIKMMNENLPNLNISKLELNIAHCLGQYKGEKKQKH